MLNGKKQLSRQREIDEIFLTIGSVHDPETGISKSETRIAEPGDLIIFISNYINKKLKDDDKSKNWRGSIWWRTMPWWKPWLGYDMDDLDAWHVGIYYIGRKRKDHQRINQWIIHSTNREGVHVEHIIPRNFTNENLEVRRRTEILRFEGIDEGKRKKIVDFAHSKVGLDFDRSKWRHLMLPYVLGLPNVFHKQNQFSCQQLAIAAYGAAGIYFPHPYKSFPIFNIGRYLGHPLGHPKDRVDPRYPYLMDHHIYRDPRFVLKAAVYQDPTTVRSYCRLRI